MGKGAAIHKAIELATSNYVIVKDADLEYYARENNNFIGPIIEGFANVVYGLRFICGNRHRILFFRDSIGNRFLTM